MGIKCQNNLVLVKSLMVLGWLGGIKCTINMRSKVIKGKTSWSPKPLSKFLFIYFTHQIIYFSFVYWFSHWRANHRRSPDVYIVHVLTSPFDVPCPIQTPSRRSTCCPTSEALRILSNTFSLTLSFVPSPFGAHSPWAQIRPTLSRTCINRIDNCIYKTNYLLI